MNLKPLLLRASGEPAALVIGRLLRRFPLRAGIVLMYHRVEERAGDPRRELVPAVATSVFKDQLRHVATHYRAVLASEIVAATTARRPGQPYPVAITFDDDLRSHRTVAEPLLRQAGVPATFFLTGATLREPRRFWWERLQVAVDRGTLDLSTFPAAVRAPLAVGTIHQMGQALEALAPEEREAISEALGVSVDAALVDEGLPGAEVAALAHAGFEIGFHTLGHHPLPSLDDVQLAAAMVVGRQDVAEAAGGQPTTIAYPHGKADVRVAEAASAAGYRAGFTNVAVAVTPKDDPLLLGRIEPASSSLGHFAAQLVRLLLRAAWPDPGRR